MTRRLFIVSGALQRDMKPAPKIIMNLNSKLIGRTHMKNRAARILFAVNLFLLSLALVVAQTDKTDKAFVKQPLAHTYSIVARDPETGQLGVAVQSHWF